MVSASYSNQSNIGFHNDHCDVTGLTTKEALIRLHNGIEGAINKYKADRSRWKWICDALCHSNENALFCWISMLILICCSLILIIISFSSDNNFRYEYLCFYGIILLALAIVNLVVVLWDSYLCHNEIVRCVKQQLSYISEIIPKCNWKPENYPHLCSPYSPCITLQWTYRDGSLVNLPWDLLVEGDLVLIKPGQPAPGHCLPISGDSPELQAGQVYSPIPQDGAYGTTGGVGGSGKLLARSPLSNQLYKMHETPFLRNLQLILNDSGTASRPVTFHNHARRLLMDNCIEQLALPLLLISIISVNAMRYIYLKEWVGSGSWLDMFVIIPICVALPLLPLVFPMLWILLSCYGNMVIAAALLQKTNNNSDNKKEHSDPFEDTDLAEKGSNIMETKLPLRMRWHLFTEILLGHQKHGLIRSANLLHVLGSVTSLCCVDKKGILSWPNPTAEKIFFLRKQDTPSCSSQDHRPRNGTEAETVGIEKGSTSTTTEHLNADGTISIDHSREIVESIYDNELKPNNLKHSAPHSHAESSSGHMQAEVLDLTHDHSCPFKLEFDDAAWKRHLLSLKPLGLAILLNTCNMDTQEHYTQFCSHVTCEALYSDDLVPITNRRCLCEVAKQIGFTDAATDIFRLESQLSTFRHVQPESVRNDMRFARSLPPSTKLKFPFPHMVAVIMREQSKNGGLQLFSQGTADIILDCCVEYWDGNKLCKLSTADRRKVQDFYQRTSLSAYCTAFAYRPLFKGAAPWLSDVYMELPMDGQQLHAPSPLPGAFSQFRSTDSLITGEIQEPDVNDIEGCFKLQSNQVFIGMVTMQYQAQADIVQLIEQLEGACIRFVHFSKENELRSRVFSEKVGLESGWNCHISLLSDNSMLSSSSPNMFVNDILRPMTSSTPCLTHYNNLNEQIVPLLSRTKTLNSVGADYIADYVRSVIDDMPGDNDSVILQQQNMPGGWQSQSLSCLTDSTEQSVPVNFDMSNRAKLPRGIENIRPHLEMVDNVPLLVSLFTDCTATTTREMISIMQDYGEVVCVIGSSANADNVGIFIQANASIAVEPLYPQVCQKVSVCKPIDPDLHCPTPIYVSKLLNSIPCSVRISREDSFSIFHLIMKARHYMKQVWNCTQYWVCCVVSLSCAQLLASLLMLPPLFSTGHIIWMSVVIIPLLSLSLVSSSPDPQVMKTATDKKASGINTEMALFVLWCYGSKFLWTVCLIPVVFGAILSSFCENILEMSSTGSDSEIQTAPLSEQIGDMFNDDSESSDDKCSIVYPFIVNNGIKFHDAWGGWSDHSYALLSVQHVMVFLLTIHFITVSVSFVHRDYLCWNKSPHRSKIWLILLFIVFLMQTFYSVFGVISVSLVSPVYKINNATSEMTTVEVTKMWDLWEDIPFTIIISVLVSPIIVFVINEFVKWEEIKANVRYQKRARLEFGTKLGMNSPF